jgi:tRNA 5-methylaminomethyl-2-thiouridine biosynthesis bifunctional protein
VPDYLPLVGPVADDEAMLERFAPLRKNARAPVHLPGRYHTGLYINIGHGSRGLAYTPLCAELLAAQINNEVLPLPRDLTNALNPARFLIRDLVKNKR